MSRQENNGFLQFQNLEFRKKRRNLVKFLFSYFLNYLETKGPRLEEYNKL